jgi:hypothetical protein
MDASPTVSASDRSFSRSFLPPTFSARNQRLGCTDFFCYILLHATIRPTLIRMHYSHNRTRLPNEERDLGRRDVDAGATSEIATKPR